MRNNAFRRVLAVSAAILAAGFIAASAPPATAATATRVVVPALSGYGYDNTDPIATNSLRRCDHHEDQEHLGQVGLCGGQDRTAIQHQLPHRLGPRDQLLQPRPE